MHYQILFEGHRLAHTLFLDYIAKFSVVYSKESISSNVHSLCHVVEDVKRFGCLSLFSAYPFENKLYHIKCLIRSGKKPLTQVAKRINEKVSFTETKTKTEYPVLKNKIKVGDNDTDFYERIYINEGFILSAKRIQDKWILSKENEIMSIITAKICNNEVSIQCKVIKFKESFFEQPIKSAFLNIYIVPDDTPNYIKEINLSSIKCKLIRLKYKSSYVFIPLLHTMSDS